MFYQMGRDSYFRGEEFDADANPDWCDGWLDAQAEDML